MGSIPTGSISLRRAVEIGLSGKSFGTSGLKSRAIGQPVGSQLASCPSIFKAGPLGFDYRTGSSTEREHPVLTGGHGFDSRPEKSKPSLARTFVPIFRRVAGLGYLDKDAVAGSSPAFGSNCRSSSVVEHVNSQFVSYPSVFQRAVDCGLSTTRQRRFNSVPRSIPGWCNGSTPGNSAVAPCPLVFQMGRSHGLSPVIGSTPICSTKWGSSSVAEQPPQGVIPGHPLPICFPSRRGP